MQGWQRPAQPVAPQRNNPPMAAQERSRWLEGSHCAWAVTQACPPTVGGKMAARAGAMQEWFVDARGREPGQRAAGIMRAPENRRRAPGATQRDVWAAMPPPGAWGPLTIDLARPPERPSRSGPRTVTATPVPCHGARRPGGQLPPVTSRAVSAQASSPPQGEEPMAGGRLTSWPGTDLPRAGPVGHWARCRWAMARCFRGLQQGWQMAQVRRQTAQRVRHARAMYGSVAWRLHNITLASRAYPAGSCEGVFAPREWHTL